MAEANNQFNYDEFLAFVEQAGEQARPDWVITTKQQAEDFADWCVENGLERPEIRPWTRAGVVKGDG